MIAPFYTHLCPFFIFCIKKDPVQRTGGETVKKLWNAVSRQSRRG